MIGNASLLTATLVHSLYLILPEKYLSDKCQNVRMKVLLHLQPLKQFVRNKKLEILLCC